MTHQESDILECKVKWTLGSITTNKASGGDEIPVELFQILKRWCCESAAFNMSANLENSAVATGLEKVSFHSSPKERQCQRIFKLPYNYAHFMLPRWYSKSFKLIFSSTWTENFQMFKLDLEKAQEPEIKLATSSGSSKKQESSRKTWTSVLLTVPKSDCVDHNKLWKIL